MLLYEHLFGPNKKKKNLQKCFHTLRSSHRKRMNHFLQFSSSDVHSPTQAKRALPPGEAGTGIRSLRTHIAATRSLESTRESWGLRGCKMSPTESTVSDLVSLLQPFWQRTALLSVTHCPTAVWSNAPLKQHPASQPDFCIPWAAGILQPALHKAPWSEG